LKKVLTSSEGTTALIMSLWAGDCETAVESSSLLQELTETETPKINTQTIPRDLNLFVKKICAIVLLILNDYANVTKNTIIDNFPDLKVVKDAA
jgi:hypothetical protein